MAILSRRFSRFRPAVLLLAAVSMAKGTASGPAAGRLGVVTTEAVQAAFTLNLTRFITWPRSAFAAADAPLVIGTFARDPVNAELDAAAKGETVDGHPVRSIRLQSLDDIAKCHVVFLSGNTARQAAVLRIAAHKPILVVGEGDGFLELGGHVRFVPEPPRIGLRISPENLKASGLEARSQLLRLAAVTP